MRTFLSAVLFPLAFCSLSGQGGPPELQILVAGFHCADSSLTFSFFHSRPSRAVEWDFGDGRRATAASPRVTFPAAGSYPVTLVVTDNFGRKDTAVLEIGLFDCDEPVLCLDNGPLDIGSIGALCADSLVEFYAVTALSLVYYRWESAGALQSFDPTWKNVFRAGEVADIRLVGTEARGCVYEGPLVTRVNECLPYCPDTVMVEAAGRLCADSLLRLSAVSEAVLSAWLWEIDGNPAGEDSTLVLRLPAGIHEVGLTAKTDRDCTYQTVWALSVSPSCKEGARCRLGLPNAFSPNGDGINDTFGPVNFCPLADYELLVFDRWGARVFATRDPSAAWDGTARGDDLPSGMYLWMIRYQTQEGEEIRESGGVAVVR